LFKIIDGTSWLIDQSVREIQELLEKPVN